MASPAGFEPATLCLEGIRARKINNLAGIIPNGTECYRASVYAGSRELLYHSVTLGRVWWWAQNWAQSGGVNPFVETNWIGTLAVSR
jgi:hypothetical protein